MCDKGGLFVCFFVCLFVCLLVGLFVFITLGSADCQCKNVYTLSMSRYPRQPAPMAG